MGWPRGAAVLTGFAVLTLPLMPVQALLVAVRSPLSRRLPHWYHRQVCRLIGVRLHIDGDVVRDRPVLLVSNHTSWLDIVVLSALAPVSFVAKREVGSWPGVGTLARLQRSVFVDRERRGKVADTANEIMARLASGDAVVLFAEGTSSDGNRVLPFRTSLFAAVKPSRAVVAARAAASPTATTDAEAARSPTAAPDVAVQTVALVYTRIAGLPLGRAERSRVGWYGDMEMLSHAWELLKAGPIDVAVRVAAPEPLASYPDRKALAQRSEVAVRSAVIGLLRGRPAGEEVEAVTIAAAPAKPAERPAARRPRGNWT